ncbi:cuticular protein precursor [Penaeus vannamei]|uniref:Cuticular protein n=1 Tax=Penaeus vannamei TaxID=6689 RepID=A0A423T2G7_PENVA|nr:cuticular protein precursor [Penaeus vannamei]
MNSVSTPSLRRWSSSRAETRDAFGVVRGSYNYVDSEGKVQTQHYVADALGFRVSGTNLPVAPDACSCSSSRPSRSLPEPVPGHPRAMLLLFTTLPPIPPSPPTTPPTSPPPTPRPLDRLRDRAPPCGPQPRSRHLLPRAQLSATSSFTHSRLCGPVVGKTGCPDVERRAPPIPSSSTDGLDSHRYIRDGCRFSRQTAPRRWVNMNALTVISVAAFVASSSASLLAYNGVYGGHHGLLGAYPYAAPIQSQYHAQDELGQYSFGYAGGPSSRAETRDAFGVVRGSYNYVDSEGKVQTQHYVADALGFRVSGTNLPVAPDAPVAAPLAALPGPLPEPVQDTPELLRVVHNPGHATSYRVLN